jgi:hypothetical protein
MPKIHSQNSHRHACTKVNRVRSSWSKEGASWTKQSHLPTRRSFANRFMWCLGTCCATCCPQGRWIHKKEWRSCLGWPESMHSHSLLGCVPSSETAVSSALVYPSLFSCGSFDVDVVRLQLEELRDELASVRVRIRSVSAEVVLVLHCAVPCSGVVRYSDVVWCGVVLWSAIWRCSVLLCCGVCVLCCAMRCSDILPDHIVTFLLFLGFVFAMDPLVLCVCLGSAWSVISARVCVCCMCMCVCVCVCVCECMCVLYECV